MIDFEQLFTEAARAITGRHIQVRFIPPPTRGAWGEIYREGRYLVLVDIDPRLSLKDKYETLLHEAAHALELPADLGAERAQPFGRFTPQSEMVSGAEYRAYQADPKEAKADRQALEWDTWAELESAKYQEPGISDELRIAYKLTVLKHKKGR